jgi:Ca2+-binding EF-hand superfamily protein
VSLFHGDRGSFKATVYLEQVIEDLFGRIDMNMNGVIGYKEFKGLMECIGKNIQED